MYIYIQIIHHTYGPPMPSPISLSQGFFAGGPTPSLPGPQPTLYLQVPPQAAPPTASPDPFAGGPTLPSPGPSAGGPHTFIHGPLHVK